MRINIEYIKDLLERILDHDKPDFDLSLINDLWEDDDKLNILVFHMEVLEDQGIIENIGSSIGLGFTRMSGGNFQINTKPLRLTATGHDFAAALVKPGIFKSLATTFKDLGPNETVKAVFKLSANALESKLEKLTE